LTLPASTTYIQHGELLQLFMDSIYKLDPAGVSAPLVLEHLPALAQGLYLDPKFNLPLRDSGGVGGCKTDTTSDLLDDVKIRLCHAWCVDPTLHPEAAAALGDLSALEAQEKYIEKATPQARAAMAWLEDTQGAQATVYGIERLTTLLRNSELAVFFKHNHFSVVFKACCCGGG
jgi:hypothetical protein